MNCRQRQNQLNSTVLTQAKTSCKNSKLNLRFFFLGEDKIDQATHLYTQSFVHLNSLWKKLGATYQEVYSANRGRVLACQKVGWLCSMIIQPTKQVVAIGPSIDVTDYLSLKSMPYNSDFLSILSKYGSELERQYFEALCPKKGDIIFNIAGAIVPKYARQGITKKFWSMGVAHFKIAGFKFMYARSTNPITTKLLCSFGGVVEKRVRFKQPELEHQIMELIKVDLNKLTFDEFGSFFGDKHEENDGF